MNTLHVVSVSGGKDSAATLLLAVQRVGRENVRAVFCDTGNEHQAVHDYLDYLEQKTGVLILRLKADFSEQIARKRLFIANDQRRGRDGSGRRLRWTNKAKRRALSVLRPSGNPFLDLCLWKGRFPSLSAPFCTEELKRNVCVEYQLSLVDAGFRVVSWQGIRRAESLRRRKALKIQRLARGMYVFRPIVDWSADDVFAFCARCGVEPNPLYLQGMGRVGCMPCVNARKGEIREIAGRFPWALDEKSEWESLVSRASKRGFSTFFHKDASGAVYSREIFRDSNISAVVEWSKTSRGGRQLDLLASLDDASVCASAYGLCE